MFPAKLILATCLSANAGLTWQQEANARSTPLVVPSQGQIGFTQMLPEVTQVRFTNFLGEAASAANRVLENGSGLAIGDFDQDGRPDLFFCSLSGRNALYRNLGDWKFADVTDEARLTGARFVCRGAVFADVNGDRWPDLLISTLGDGVRCYLNDGAGHFNDQTDRALPPNHLGSMTLALADVDGNGTLDLYVTNYRTDDIRDRSRVEVQRINGRVVVAPALRDRLEITPEGLREFGEPDVLYLNDGQGRFQPVSWTNGAFLSEDNRPLSQAPLDWGLTATLRDLNGDGFPDLYVCNDYWSPDRIWMNDGRGKFTAIHPLAIRHTSENSMGIDAADIDRDGHMDFLVLDMLSRDSSTRKRQVLAQTKVPVVPGEIANRPQMMRNTLFHNRGDGTFAEIADFAGLPGSEWSWQPVFIDVDLDGYEDLLIATGHRRDVQDIDATTRIRSLQTPGPKGLDPAAQQEAFTRRMLEHARLYPPLESPIVAFRNLGNLRFTETTALWGTAAPGVHQGIALADLDGDGDLDFAVNNLNAACGLYRNDSTAPRIAVQLRGLAPNRAGIGARVTLNGGAVPTQTQEMVCGGRYLSGFENLLVFAPGSAPKPMTLTVHWRSGRRSVVENVQSNRRYEIDELEQPLPPKVAATLPHPLFVGAEVLAGHRHVDASFDDFARQPLLPKKLSQLGPGVAWFDLDGNGTDDLILGTGQGGSLAVYLGDGRGGFQALPNRSGARSRDQTGLVALRTGPRQSVLLAGSSNYEDGQASGASVQTFDGTGKQLLDTLPSGISSTGPLALADLDGDGDLDLFVGGRVVPGRYPEPASSQIFLQDHGTWHLDSTNRKVLEKIGLVSGAVWTDVDGDGRPDLVLALEWGPIRVFKNDKGQLREITTELGLQDQTGWWSGITAGDFDGDGRLDLIAANWGLNNSSRASPTEPAQLYYGDFLQRGTVDLLEVEYDRTRGALVPCHRLDFLAPSLPFLRERFPSSKGFSEATATQVLADVRPRVSFVSVNTLASTVFLNRAGRFVAVPLPDAAQFSPASAVTVADFDGDGHEDAFLSQNWFALPWQTPRQDAGRGLLLLGDGSGGFRPMAGQDSGILIYGEQRGAATADFNQDGRPDLAVSQNGAPARLLVNEGGRPGLRVRLQGSKDNPHAIGAVVRLQFADHLGPAREVHAGSGYWSQDSPVPVMASPTPPASLLVRWPGGKTTTHPVPQNAREIWVQAGAEVKAQ